MRVGRRLLQVAYVSNINQIQQTHYSLATSHYNRLLASSLNRQYSMSATPPHDINLLELVSACVDAAEHAAEIIRSVFSSGKLDTIDKSAGGNNDGASFDPQTVADRRAQQCIVASIVAAFPQCKLRIIGEEDEVISHSSHAKPVNVHRLSVSAAAASSSSALTAVADELTLWIDPLDGTREFTEGHVQYVTTLIGITRNNRPIAGVIHAPFIRQTVWAICGVTKAETIRGDGTQYPFVDDSDEVVGSSGVGGRIVTTKSHFTADMAALITALNPRSILRSGGCGSKVLLLLNEHADAYVYPSNGTKRWDTAACEAVITAAGGKLTDAYGQQIKYERDSNYHNVNGVLATLHADRHKQYVLPEGAIKS